MIKVFIAAAVYILLYLLCHVYGNKCPTAFPFITLCCACCYERFHGIVMSGISAASFNGSHGVSYRTDMEPSTVHRVSFMVRTHSLFGAILETVHGGYFLKVRMSGGGLEVSFLLSDTEFGFSSSFSSDFPINDGRWYHADIIFESSVIKLTVIHDGIIVDEDEARFFTYVSDVLQSLIYQSEVRVAYSATPTEQRFVGCLEDVRVDGILLSFVSNELTNNNIATPRFSVSAASLETGCDSSASSCAERRSLCGAWGRCQDTWSGIECTCLTGYSGRYCEWRQAVCNGQGLCQNGGTCVERIGTPTCICPASYTNVRSVLLIVVLLPTTLTYLSILILLTVFEISSAHLILSFTERTLVSI